jgi:hypothetical protein
MPKPTKRPHEPLRIERIPAWGGAVFSGTNFPTDPKERELCFARSFAAGLAHFKHRIITDLRINPDDFPDILAKENGCELGFEVTEIHGLVRRYLVAERKYRHALIDRLRNMSCPTPGGTFTLRFQAATPPAEINSQQGKQLLEAMERSARMLHRLYLNLSHDHRYRMLHTDIETSLVFDVSLWRVIGAAHEIQIAFTPPFDLEKMRGIVAREMVKKLTSRYASSKLPIHLLVVSRTSYAAPMETELSEAHTQAESLQGGIFQEIWYMEPFPIESELCAWVTRIWPIDP